MVYSFNEKSKLLDLTSLSCKLEYPSSFSIPLAVSHYVGKYGRYIWWPPVIVPHPTRHELVSSHKGAISPLVDSFTCWVPAKTRLCFRRQMPNRENVYHARLNQPLWGQAQTGKHDFSYWDSLSKLEHKYRCTDLTVSDPPGYRADCEGKHDMLLSSKRLLEKKFLFGIRRII